MFVYQRVPAKRLHNELENDKDPPFSMGNSSISITIFNSKLLNVHSYMLNYQRVSMVLSAINQLVNQIMCVNLVGPQRLRVLLVTELPEKGMQ